MGQSVSSICSGICHVGLERAPLPDGGEGDEFGVVCELVDELLVEGGLGEVRRYPALSKGPLSTRTKSNMK
eukprot:6559680-Pyramimonas_sp.AAC.1